MSTPQPAVQRSSGLYAVEPNSESVRADIASECSVLGWILDGRGTPEQLRELWSLLSPEDFYRPQHETLARIITGLDREGQSTDVIRVLQECVRKDVVRQFGDRGLTYLHDLVKWAPVDVWYHVNRVRESAHLREAVLLHTRMLQRLSQPDADVVTALQEAQDEIYALQLVSRAGIDLGLSDFADFMAEPDPDVEFVIPNMLARREKVIFTGGEGLGKSTLCRQIALCVAAGLDPFTRDYTEPKRVLWLDAENPAERNRRKMRPIYDLVLDQGRSIQRGMLQLQHLRSFDLMSSRDVSHLVRVVSEARPDLIYIGPLYKIVSQSLDKDEQAVPILRVLDGICDISEAALMMEAHAGHGKGTGGKREWRPRGSSALLGWPDFGFGLSMSEDDQVGVDRLVDVNHWRGAREERAWPAQMCSDKRWPWSAW